jgi:predicted aspartyl protease
MKNLHLLRLVMLVSAGLTAMSAAPVAQDNARPGVETVLVPGSRDGCSLQLLNMVPLAMDNGQLTVPADVNGKTRPFLFDTASLTEQMTEAAAQSLGLHPASPNNGPTINGNFNEAYGKASTGGFQMPAQDHAIVGSP